ncbi:type II secretion system protein N [Polaromonas sp.]|uniref:type II secretion system protein N n=1 Tax=Polaromonas sp. TaxID=1869339 RepID=UPI00286B6AC3|nr:type II secretion system protein N [Polaromonas sp.]
MARPHALSHRPTAASAWRWALLGALLGLGLALLLYAPASWLAAALHRASSGQVQLIEARGTVWTGSARLLFTGGAGSRDSALLPGHLDWQLRPGWRALNLQVSAGCCMTAPLRGQLAPRWGGAVLRVADGASQWPAGMLAGLGTPWNTVQAEGSLRLVTQGLSLDWFDGRLALAGRAELTALALSSRLSTLKPMGSYRLALTGGSAPALELATLEGSLQLSGSGRWVGSRLRFEGVASASAEHEAALANLLNIIGRRNGARSIITLG